MDKSIIAPKVSVVICAYNEEKLITEAIRSVQNQVTDFSFEIIAINNASTDKTASVAKDLGVKVVFEKKKGLCYARQAGLDASHGEILIFLDADVRLPNKKWLQEVVDYLTSHPKTVGLSCKQKYYDANIAERTALFVFNHILSSIINALLRFFHRPDIYFGFTMIMRTQAIKKAGGINQNFVFYGEDVMMAHELYKEGEVRYMPNFSVFASARSFDLQKVTKTMLLYWGMFFLITFDKYKTAEAISRKYS